MIILEIKVFMIIFITFENDNLNNELIKTNHLLYITVHNSNLDSNEKFLNIRIKMTIK